MNTKQILTTIFGIWFGLRMSQILVPVPTSADNKGKKTKKKIKDISPDEIPTTE
jgi:hypothetical protein